MLHHAGATCLVVYAYSTAVLNEGLEKPKTLDREMFRSTNNATEREEDNDNSVCSKGTVL